MRSKAENQLIPVMALIGIVALFMWILNSPTIHSIGLARSAAAQEPDTQEDPVFVIVCDAKPGRWLVLDSTGKWISAVQIVDLGPISIGDTTPKITCTMWSGPIKPNNPIIKTWNLAQLKSVTEPEFQEMLDSLQADPDAIRRRVEEEEARTGQKMDVLAVVTNLVAQDQS
jgi:hypothetical protein